MVSSKWEKSVLIPVDARGYSDSGGIDFLIVIQTRGVLRVTSADIDSLRNIKKAPVI